MRSYNQLTHNIFITKSLPAIEQVHFAKHRLTDNKSYNAQINSLSKEDLAQSFIASPYRNDGLLSFEYAFKANGKQGGHTLTIKMLETSRLLEVFLMENDPLARMIKVKNDYVNAVKSVNALPSNLVAAARSMAFGAHPIAAFLGAFANPDKSEDSDPVLKVGYDSLDFDQKKKLMNRYYFSFGTGDNLDDFNGPYTMDLVLAELTNDQNNNRIIEVTFVPNEHSIKSWSSKFSEELGYKDDMKPTSQFMTSNIFNVNSAKMKPIHTELPATRDNKKGVPDPINFDSGLRNLLKRYIGSFTLQSSQAVVVLPHEFGVAEIGSTGADDDGLRQKLGVRAFGLGARSNPGGSKPFQATGINKDRRRLDFKSGIFARKQFSSDLAKAILENESGTDKLKRDMGLKIGWTNDFSYSRKSKELQDYIDAEDLPSSQFISVQNALNAANIFNDDLNFLSERVENDRQVYIDIVELEYNAELAKINSDALAVQNQLDAILVNRESLLEPIPPDAPPGEFDRRLVLLEIELRERELGAEARRLFNEGGLTENGVLETILSRVRDDHEKETALNEQVKSQKLSKAEKNKETALDEGSKESKEFEADVIQAFNNEREAVFRKNPSLTNPSLLGFAGAKDSIVADILGGDPFSTRPENVNVLGDLSLRKYNLLNEVNVSIDFDMVKDTIQQLIDVPKSTLNIVMESRNEPPSTAYDGFSPVISPLVRFADGLKKYEDPGTESRYDFYEESDMRVLKLWEKYGIVATRHKPAYVFGDMNEIKKLLYLEGGEPHLHTIATVFGLEFFEDGAQDFAYVQHQEKILNLYTAYVKDFLKEFPPEVTVPLELIHNMPNANVLSLKYDLNNYYAALLNMPVSPLLDEQSIGSTRVKVLKAEATRLLGGAASPLLEAVKDYKSSPDLLQFITDVSKDAKTSTQLTLGLADEIEKNSGFFFRGETKFKTQMDMFALMFLCLNADKVTDDNMKVGLETTPDLMSRYYKTIARETDRLLVQCTVKTLPQFNRKAFIGRKAILFGKTGGMITGGIEDTEVNTGSADKDSLRDAPYNGTYTITGYKHVISPTESYSTYDLVRGAANEDVPITLTVKEFMIKSIRQALGDVDKGFDKALERNPRLRAPALTTATKGEKLNQAAFIEKRVKEVTGATAERLRNILLELGVEKGDLPRSLVSRRLLNLRENEFSN